MSLSPSSSIRGEKHGLGEKSPAETDLERQGSPPSQSSPGDTTTVASENPPHDGDVLLVDWDGPDDKENPKNWPYRKKWAATLIVSAFTFISPVSSSMVAPASAQVAREFGITSTVMMAMTTSVFVLGYAFGPLILGPLSEIYGRSRVLQCSNLFYLAWNIGCGFAQNQSQLIAFRFLAGLGGSAPLSIGGGVLGDTWHPEERGKAIAIYSLAPLLGPVLGPVCGGWIAERSTWRWVFWSTSIVDVVIQVLGLIFLQETFAPYLLQEKAKRIEKEMDMEKSQYKSVKSIYATKEDRHWKSIFKKALTRPFVLFYYEPIVQLLGIFMAYLYGVFYLFLTTMPAIFRDIYHEDVGIAGLHYIALGLGLSFASQVNARALDALYKHFKQKNNGVGEPEFRLPSMIPGTILMPIGLLLAGWSAEHHLHWIATDIGIACVGAGMILTFQAIQTYVVDSFTLHAASALAAVSFLRSLAGFGFPLFAPIMYERLGYGKGDTILACVSIGLGCPAPILFWKFGRRIRMSSKYAHHAPPAQRQDSRPEDDAPNDEGMANEEVEESIRTHSFSEHHHTHQLKSSTSP
ncbi:MFS polyamine transporter [Panaeolus papilionaceus]|nr:MFS polyamine transporter [Panaeolus papilionaceus]